MKAPRNEREAHAEMLRATRSRRQPLDIDRAEKAGRIALGLWVAVVIVLIIAIVAP